MENMTCAFMNQCLELVKSHVENTMPILHGCLFGDFESAYPFSLEFHVDPFNLEFHVDTHLSDFEGKKDISSLCLACASPVVTSISMDIHKDVLNIFDSFTPLIFRL